MRITRSELERRIKATEFQLVCIKRLLGTREVAQYKIDWFNKNESNLSARSARIIIGRLLKYPYKGEEEIFFG